MKPEELRATGVRVTGTASLVLEDFSLGWRVWRQNSEKSPVRWTRKISDAKWRGPDGAKLAVTLKMAETNSLCLEVIENEHRTYRGPRRTFACVKEVAGRPQAQTVLLDVSDFVDSEDGTPLKSWGQMDQLGIGMHRPAPPKKRGTGLAANQQPNPMPWRGPEPEFIRLEWR